MMAGTVRGALICPVAWRWRIPKRTSWTRCGGPSSSTWLGCARTASPSHIRPPWRRRSLPSTRPERWALLLGGRGGAAEALEQGHDGTGGRRGGVAVRGWQVLGPDGGGFGGLGGGGLRRGFGWVRRCWLRVLGSVFLGLVGRFLSAVWARTPGACGAIPVGWGSVFGGRGSVFGGWGSIFGRWAPVIGCWGSIFGGCVVLPGIVAMPWVVRGARPGVASMRRCGVVLVIEVA